MVVSVEWIAYRFDDVFTGIDLRCPMVCLGLMRWRCLFLCRVLCCCERIVVSSFVLVLGVHIICCVSLVYCFGVYVGHCCVGFLCVLVRYRLVAWMVGGF